MEEVAFEEDRIFREVDLDKEVAGIMTIGTTEIRGIIEDKIDQTDLIGAEAHVVVEIDLEESIIEVFHAVFRNHHLVERIKWMMSIEEVAREVRRMMSSGRK